MLSDHGQTQGATFKQRNGYGLDELVERSLAHGDVSAVAGGDEQSSMVGLAVSEATGKQQKHAKNDVSDRDVVVLGSGNLGLVYLMEERRRLTLEELDQRHPNLLPALREHPHVGWLLVRSSSTAPSRSAPTAPTTSPRAASRARTHSRRSHPPRPRTCCAPTASRTSPTSWSEASTTPTSTKAAPSKNSSASTAASAASKPAPSSSTPPTSKYPPNPSSAPPSVHAILTGWRNTLQNTTNDALPAGAAEPVAPAVAEPSAGHTG